MSGNAKKYTNMLDPDPHQNQNIFYRIRATRIFNKIIIKNPCKNKRNTCQ